MLDRVRLVHGWWEDKDQDDLDREIAAKRAKGYPTNNIVFEDTRAAVLIQNGQEVLRAATTDGPALNRLWRLFSPSARRKSSGSPSPPPSSARIDGD